MGPRIAASFNAILVIAVIAWNYWTAAKGFNGNTVGGMSDEYDSFFRPASYAFSIWGLIFLLQIVHAGYQLKLAFKTDEHRLFRELGPWLILTNIANIAWTVAWLSEWTGLSVLILLSMNVFLFIGMRRLRMEVWDAPMRVIAFEWWPIVLYAGWVAVAVLANFSAWLAKEAIVPGDSVIAAVLLVGLAGLYNVYVVLSRNMREHALVAIWAYVAIAVAQWESAPVVASAAVGAAVLLLVLVSGHALKNRRTLPFVGRPGSATE
ncbi:MAG: tryptophan-rich sensory protein [Polyangiales bacterium]